jgi:iron(III)-enterobactin esterase
VPRSRVFNFTLDSQDSNIFTGMDAQLNPPMAFTRSVRVSIPSQYVDGAEAPFMVTSDGFYTGIQTAMENLVVDPDPARRVPPLVVIGVQNGPLPNNERSIEYDTVSDRYWRFITSEVIPAVLDHAALEAAYPNFKLTSNPDGRGAYGCSSGGPAAFGMGWFGDFTRLLIFSGSFTDLQKGDAATEAAHPLGAWEYASMVAAAPLTPLRVFLEVGENDNGANSAEETHRNWVIGNRNLAAALAAKGNHYRFIYATGAGHCDDNARNQVMPEGLIWLWRGYQAQ